MSNLFGASCYRCGKFVEIGEGKVERLAKPIDGKLWRVQHNECAKRYAGTDHQYDKPETWNRQMELPL